MPFFWYSMSGAEETWKMVASEHRNNIITETKPAFVTVLDADKQPTGLSREERLKMKYSGPLYFDWDAAQIEHAIFGLHQFLNKLEGEHQFDLAQARLYATGGRGFHLEIPMECLLPKIPAAGVRQLPIIYREMALKLAVDTLDLRIYSAQRGRMWRVPGVPRASGACKVPITVQEARAMTPEMYAQLCKQPRYYRGREAEYPLAPWLMDPKGDIPPPAAPTLNLGLQALYEACRKQVDSLLRKQTSAPDDRPALAKYNGQVPVAVKEILNGQHLRPGVGFNDLALQFAILAASFGMSEKDFLAACEGVIKHHSGDGWRYASPRARSDGLASRLALVANSDVYTFSLKALYTVCDPKSAPADLFGALANSVSRLAPELTPEQLAAGEAVSTLTPEQQEALRAALENDDKGYRVTSTGIYLRKGAEWESVSNLGLVNPSVLCSAETGEPIGVHAYARVPGGPSAKPSYEPVRFDIGDFSSAKTLDKVFSSKFSSFGGLDIGAIKVRDILVKTARENERVQYTLSTEGMELIPSQGGDSAGERTLAWVARDRVVLPQDVAPASDENGGTETLLDDNKPRFYFHPSKFGEMRPALDAHLAPTPAPKDPAFKEFMENLLRVNTKHAMGAILGWFVSCFHRQMHHAVHKEFPLLWVYGEAGSGKSSTLRLPYRLFSSEEPDSWLMFGSGTTSYGLGGELTLSTTAPLVLDEFKESADPKRYNEVLGILRGAYNKTYNARGGGRGDPQKLHATKWHRPAVILSEAFVSEPAIMERVVPVALRPKEANHELWQWVHEAKRPDHLTRLGSLLIRRTLGMDMAKFEAKWTAAKDTMSKRLPKFHPRVQSNYAVVLMGLDFLDESLDTTLRIDMRGELDGLKEAVLANAAHRAKTVPIVSEAVKTLKDIALLTNEIDQHDTYAIRENFEYIFVDGLLHVNMETVGWKYISAARHRHMDLYYRDRGVLISGLAEHHSVVSADCIHSPLHGSTGARIFSFDPKVLAENGVMPFKGQPDL